jgi:hypothetical protein
LKYRPDFPARFGSIEDARAHCQEFFRWYNTEHRHSGIALMPPDTVHYGRSTALTAQRGVTLDAAFAAHPTRFKGIAPQPPSVPLAVWINPPKKGNQPTDHHTHLLVKLVNKCASSPLTCSAIEIATAAVNALRDILFLSIVNI